VRITVRAADHARMPDTDPSSTRASRHQQTVSEHLRKLAQRQPDRTALVAGDQEYRATYAELFEQTDLAARGLMATGVAQGDRVAIWAPDRYERVVLGLAAARAGAILVAIDPACDAAELGDALGATRVRLLAMSRGFRGADHEALLQQVRDQCPQLRCVLMLDGEWHAFLEEGMHVSEFELAAREASVSPDDRVCMRPVAVTHRELLAGPDHATRALGVGALAVILRGACVVVANRAPA
jgi:acyl-CoA synthetase (AMP-forming)/AMP-acid ligase II